jgi:hypothetical protein
MRKGSHKWLVLITISTNHLLDLMTGSTQRGSTERSSEAAATLSAATNSTSTAGTYP